MTTRQFLTQTVTPDSLHDQERIFGFNFAETASSDAKIELRAGSVTGEVINYLNLSADQTGTIFFPLDVFAKFPGGVYVKVVSGAVAGVLYY